MESAICLSIRERRILRFSYDGGPRTVESYCHGMSSAGNEVLLAYQTEGFSRSGKPVGWRLFQTVKMQDVEVTDRNFKPDRPEYNPDDKRIGSVHCCI